MGKEIRALPVALEIRATNDGDKRTIAGQIKYNTESAAMRDYWGDAWCEELAAGCFDKSLQTRNVVGLLCHTTPAKS